MKKWKIAVIVGLVMIGIICIILGIMKGRRDGGELGYSVIAQDSSDERPAENKGVDRQSPSDADGAQSDEGDSVFEEKKKIKLVDQINDYGKLSEKTRKILLDKVRSGKSVVILDCQNVQAPEKMKKYRKIKRNNYSEDTKKKLETLFCEAVKDNPIHLPYHPAWLPDDYYENRNEDSDAALYNDVEEPYMAITPTGSDGAELIKGIYDTRVRVEDRFLLTRKRAVNKTKRFLKNIISELDLGCEVAPKETWEIVGLTQGSEIEKGFSEFSYQNGIQESYYGITAYCALDGYIVAGDTGELENSDYFTMYYSESGWLYMNCVIPHAYRDTGKYFRRILSLKDIQDRLLEEIKQESGVVAYGVSEAQIGYVATEREIRPAWILYGEKKCVGGGEGRYILDAVTGEVLTWQKSFK